ncbi:hypothetical protein HELRODRAFT_181429 [Helobdella robusta]|uniref:FAM161 centrosomal protein A n=1 Tax=Helobdella robusta TaxID=6412 RepID=T1FH01_HELRO|nr:hypothetical protein HELRODRAFT_181429 [Helobdella robusta]ESN92384.1 hypothetical protein HELRODRAFT_181429 [Helobdella robusta]
MFDYENNYYNDDETNSYISNSTTTTANDGYDSGYGKTWIVPDLSNMTEDEFQYRLKSLRREHQKVLALCDEATLRKSKNGPIRKGVLEPSIVSSQSSSTDDDEECYYNSDSITKNYENSGLKSYNSDELLNYKLNRFFTNNNNEDQEIFTDPRPSVRRRRSLTDLDQKRIRWKTPYITVCKPFNMTIREEQKKIMKPVSDKIEQIKNDKKLKQLMEEKELRKRFRSLPIPANTYELLLEEMERKKQSKKRRNELKRREILLDRGAEFSFLEREKRKQVVRSANRILDNKEFLENRELVNTFKAKPFPKNIYSQESDEKLRRENLLKQIESLERAEKMLRSSQLPRNMKYHSPKHRCHSANLNSSHSHHQKRPNYKSRALLRSDVDRRVFALSPDEYANKNNYNNRTRSPDSRDDDNDVIGGRNGDVLISRFRQNDSGVYLSHSDLLICKGLSGGSTRPKTSPCLRSSSMRILDDASDNNMRSYDTKLDEKIRREVEMDLARIKL